MSSVKGYVWFTPGANTAWMSRNTHRTVHYLVMWGDEPMFYDNTGPHAYWQMLLECLSRVDTLRHLEMSERKRPKRYTAVECWPPTLNRGINA